MSIRSPSESTLVDDMPPPPGLSPELPSYAEAAALSSTDEKLGRDLKESFSALMREQLDVQRLFATVAARLEHTSRIGREHRLYAEWTGLREVSEDCRTSMSAAEAQGIDRGTIGCTETRSRARGSAPTFCIVSCAIRSQRLSL
jgi:hypothetical protein